MITLTLFIFFQRQRQSTVFHQLVLFGLVFPFLINFEEKVLACRVIASKQKKIYIS